MFLQLIGVAIACCLSAVDASSIMNNSLNPSSPSISGTVLSSSTPPSLLETYLQTFLINEQQNIVTTVYHGSTKHHTSTVEAEKEKITTASPLSLSSMAATDSSQLFSSNQNTATPFISTGSSLPRDSSTSPINLSENPESPVLIQGPILLGCGPNNREGIGIQKALDWLREKRVSDYGWENDTHMVILAKEVSAEIN